MKHRFSCWRRQRRINVKCNLVVAIFLAATGPVCSAYAQTAPPVCLAKSDSTGGRLRFVALEEYAPKFESAGFRRFACPTLTLEIFQGQRDRCGRLLAQSAEDQQSLGALYGISVSEMCRATTAWAQSRSGQ